MAFDPKTPLVRTKASAAPILDSSIKLRLEQEMRTIHTQMNRLVDALEEIREHLKSTTPSA